jgi:hypothetical protein
MGGALLRSEVGPHRLRHFATAFCHLSPLPPVEVREIEKIPFRQVV